MQATGKFHCLKEILSPAEISTEHKYLRLIFLMVHSPKDPVGLINKSAEGFLSYIPAHAWDMLNVHVVKLTSSVSPQIFCPTHFIAKTEKCFFYLTL